MSSSLTRAFKRYTGALPTPAVAGVVIGFGISLATTLTLGFFNEPDAATAAFAIAALLLTVFLERSLRLTTWLLLSSNLQTRLLLLKRSYNRSSRAP